MLLIEDIRTQFPILAQKIDGYPLIYLDTAATAHKPQIVIDAITRFYSQDYATVHRGVYPLAVQASERYEAVREQLKRFFSAPEGLEVIFTRGATDSINLIAQSFSQAFLEPGDEILFLATEHHSNIVPWQIAAKRFGLKIRAVPTDTYGDINQIEEAFSEKTRLVAFSHISNSTGALHPASDICSLCKERGIYTLVDAAQSAAHIPIDLSDMCPDFFVASAHKMYGPTGLGFLIARASLLDEMPPVQGGGDMIDEVRLESYTYAKAPLRFEAGTPMIAQVIGLGAALTFLEKIGIHAIYDYEKELFDYLSKQLSRIERVRITASPKKHTSLISFVIEGVHSLDVVLLLGARGICLRSGHLCAQPALQMVHKTDHLLRVSLGLYNTKEEIDFFCSALENIINAVAQAS